MRPVEWAYWSAAAEGTFFSEIKSDLRDKRHWMMDLELTVMLFLYSFNDKKESFLHQNNPKDEIQLLYHWVSNTKSC